MTTTDDTSAGAAVGGAGAAVETFAERIFGAVLGAQLVQAIDLGDRLGWYAALAAGGPATSGELAERSGADERYAREWLEHQAAVGVLTVDDVDAPPSDRRFALPAELGQPPLPEDQLRLLVRVLGAEPGLAPVWNWQRNGVPCYPGSGNGESRRTVQSAS